MTSESKTVVSLSELEVKQAILDYVIAKTPNKNLQSSNVSLMIRTRTTGIGPMESDEKYVEGSVTLVH